MRSNNTIYWALALILVGFNGAGCATDSGGNQEREYIPKTNPGPNVKRDDTLWKKEAALVKAQSCEEAHELIVEAAISNMNVTLEREKEGWKNGEMMMMEDGAESEPSVGGSGDKEYSDTNTQVAGVDEADLAKTDGDYIYTLMGADLVIVKAWPANESQEVGRVSLPGSPSALYRYGDELVVLASANIEKHISDYDSDLQDEDGYYPYWIPVSLVIRIDASDKAAPVIVERRLIQGYTNATRRIDNKVYLVQNTYPSWYGIRYWPDNLSWDAEDDEIDAAFDKLAQSNEDFLKGLELKDWLPRHYVLDENGESTMAQAKGLVGCEEIYAPKVFSGTGMVTTVTLDLEKPVEDALDSSAVVGQWGIVYASMDSLYVATTDWYWWGWWTISDDEDSDEPMFTTHIHKFSLDADSGVAEYRASGEVQGYPINQFSMDEREGFLRIATTDGLMWNSQTSESFVTVLEERGVKLNEVGKVGGLGMGETIRSVRFMGERGYIVTFRQVDPLYTIDLSEPTNPVVAGELKITGFSSYMHPIDSDHLLTIGYDGTETGQITGMALQIFDVSDAQNPTQVHKTLIGEGEGWGWSEAASNHHAFTYFAARKMLAIPFSGWDGNGGYTSRLMLYKVSVDEGVSPAGSITHLGLLDQLVKDDECYYNTAWSAQIRRGIFIEDFVYSVSRLGVVVHETEAVEQGALSEMLLFDPSVKKDNPYWGWYGNYSYCWD